MNTEMLFVYGTLRAGGSNHFRLDGGRMLGSGVVKGRLYRVDWYPALFLDPDGDSVIGDLVEIPRDILAALDEFEGLEYQRVRVTVMPTHGSATIEAWVWEYLNPVDESRRIPSGDWLSAVGGD